MAHINISITRENGVQINATGQVDDADIAGIATTLAGLIVTSVNAPAPPAVPAPTISPAMPPAETGMRPA